MSDRSAISFSRAPRFFDDKDHFFSSTLHAIVYPMMRQAKKCIHTRILSDIVYTADARARAHALFDMRALLIVRRFAFMSKKTDAVRSRVDFTSGRSRMIVNRSVSSVFARPHRRCVDPCRGCRDRARSMTAIYFSSIVRVCFVLSERFSSARVLRRRRRVFSSCSRPARRLVLVHQRDIPADLPSAGVACDGD